MKAADTPNPKALRTKVVLTLGILIVLVGPVLFALWLRSGTQQYYAMPTIGPRTVVGGDTLVHSVAADSLLLADGTPLSVAGTGHQRIVLLMSPTCADTLLRESLRSLTGTYAYLLQNEDAPVDVRLTVIGYHASDSSSRMRAALQTTPKDRRSLVELVPYQGGLPAFVQTQLLTSVDTNGCRPPAFQALLLDYQGHLRAVYPDLRAAYLKRIQEDIRTLRFEQKYPQQLLPSQTQPLTLEDAAF